ncbi:MAG TPA: UDP-N-acetylenolpyruvoylglucosamine reductase [Lachnospiraceae bacterium]|nr:UDP-N-acetylenolpyruvoylglucosamine reductase [Lachnospiraceae bacterium]
MLNMLNKLINILGDENVFENEPMSMHTTFRIGGPARYFAIVNSEEDLIKTIKLVREENQEYFVLGNGSNILVSDKGFDGVVLQLSGEFDTIHLSGNNIIAGSGLLLSQVAKTALDNSLAGLEFASGIPGTIGGAIVMNAGAYGSEMKDVVKAVRILWLEPDEPTIETLTLDDLKLSYRHSILKERKGIVLDVKLTLKPGSKEEIKSIMDDLAAKRREKQPLEYPSAGSTFKRPEGYFAAKLIEDAGLKGYKVGTAMVSDKHAGFVVNTGGAKATEVKQVMDHVVHTVNQSFGITLEPEVILLGEFDN